MRTRASSLAIVLLTTLLSGCTETSAGLGVVRAPEVGEVEAAYLSDGHPVFVVGDLDGTIHVVDAISTHLIGDQMAWCPSSRTIDDVFHGARWDPTGRYVSGPGRTDLGYYEFELSDDASELTVSAYIRPTSRTESPVGVSGNSCVDGGYQVHPFHDTN